MEPEAKLNLGYKVVDDYVMIGDVAYPITHSFIVGAVDAYIMEYYNSIPPSIGHTPHITGTNRFGFPSFNNAHANNERIWLTEMAHLGVVPIDEITFFLTEYFWWLGFQWQNLTPFPTAITRWQISGTAYPAWLIGMQGNVITLDLSAAPVPIHPIWQPTGNPLGFSNLFRFQSSYNANDGFPPPVEYEWPRPPISSVNSIAQLFGNDIAVGTMPDAFGGPVIAWNHHRPWIASHGGIENPPGSSLFQIPQRPFAGIGSRGMGDEGIDEERRPIAQQGDYVIWIRGTPDSIEWNTMVNNMPINDTAFLPGQSGVRRISPDWFTTPWERYPHLV